MGDAQSSEHGVDGAYLTAVAAAGVSDLRRRDMVGASRVDERERGESLDDGLPVLWTAEPLQQFLKDESRREDILSAAQRLPEAIDGGVVRGSIAPKGERPDARVDEQPHVRVRSRL